MDIPEEKHDHASLDFPDNFLWGAATSAHQVEGDNFYNDWWQWEQNQPLRLRSGQAADQYHLYESDFDLAKSLNHNAHRLSIEWSRIEPEEGQFNQEAIDHYKSVLKSLKNRGFTVMLTLHHFTNPLWFAKKGGWESFKAPAHFERFVKKVTQEFKDDVDFWITINEPELYTQMAYLGGDEAGRYPPGKKSNWAALKVVLNLARAHKKAYQAIHKIIPQAPVGIAQNVASFETFHKHSILELIAVGIGDIITNHSFYFLTKGYHDFLGLNYYRHFRINLKTGLIPEMIDPAGQKKDVSDLGWEVYPEGLFEVLADLSDGIPIYVTEAGIASTNDDRRTRFLIHFLQEIYLAIKAGVQVRGFFYWSLIDNFEWHRGFEPRFGLIEVDYQTQKRQIRPSALVYSEIIKASGIPHKLLKLLGHGLNVKEELKHL